PRPTPPFPAEALSVLCPPHVASNLLFHPVLNHAEALAGVSDRKVVHPTAQHRIDQLHNPASWLRLVAAKYVLEASAAAPFVSCAAACNAHGMGPVYCGCVGNQTRGSRSARLDLGIGMILGMKVIANSERRR